MKDSSQLIPFYLTRLLADAALPKWLVAGSVGALQFVAPGVAPGMLAAASGLVIIDTLTGVARAHSSGLPVTSAKLGRFLTKCFAYAVAIVTVALAMQFIPNAKDLHGPAVTMLLSGIALQETYSICENLNVLGFPLPPVLKTLLQNALEHKAKADEEAVTQNP